jgi:hypothetical protein
LEEQENSFCENFLAKFMILNEFVDINLFWFQYAAILHQAVRNVISNVLRIVTDIL